MQASNSESNYKPLVAAATRTGLTLLVNIARQFIKYSPTYRVEPRRYILERLCGILGQHLHQELTHAFRRAGLEQDLLYNAVFHPLAGGTKWLKEDDVETACIRKYVGVKAKGDFTLIVAHPREVLETDDIIHSHEDPRRWFRDDYYADCTRFASVRHPAGAINSAMFSINALTSEYIQRFLPAEQDNDLLRQDIAKYKLSNLEFFRSVLKYYVGFISNLVEVKHQFILMRWEDLIQTPVPTILRLAREAKIPVSEGDAEAIWTRLDHVNLTGPHQHNYRRGKGKVNDWRNWLINEHIDILREADIEDAMTEFGYPKLQYLDVRDYTPFQKEMADLVAAGKIYEDFRDRELFGFSVQKSNVDWRDLDGFRGYEWRRHSKIERSCLSDDSLEMQVWDRMETALGRVNGILTEYLSLPDPTPRGLLDGTRSILRSHRRDWMRVDFGRYLWRFRKCMRRLETDPMLHGHAGGHP